MSLSEVVLEIAGEMEGKADCFHEDISTVLKSFAASLRMAVKASQNNSPLTPSHSLHDVIQDTNKKLVRESQQSLHDAMSSIRKQESFSGSVIELVGCPDSSVPEFLPVDESIPVGACPIVNGSVYRMEGDGKLHFLKEETEKYRASRTIKAH